MNLIQGRNLGTDKQEMSIVTNVVDQAQLDLVNGTIPVLCLTYPFEAGVHATKACFSTSPTVKRVGQGSRSHVDVGV